MKQKILNIAYCVIFMAIIIVPALLTNTKKAQVSAIDNKTLTEWPHFTWKLENRDLVEDYVDDRIGLREPAINSYIALNDRLFDVMVHPLFMYGQEGHIFYKDADYIAAYQHLNTDTKMLDDFVTFLEQTQDYLSKKDIEFLYFVCPDKKTIYSEYFPKSIHVNEANVSVTDYLDEKLSATDVDYIIPIDELLQAKNDKVIYNKKYDATHWNEFGAMTAHKLIDAKAQEWFDDVRPLTEDDFNLEFVKVDSLDIAKFPIEEEVPIYSLKNDTSADATDYLLNSLQGSTTTFFYHYINEEAQSDEILLVFVDSYFGSYEKYYNNRYKEVYFVHRQNYDYLQYYVNLFFPNAVIFETAERSVSSEMPLLADFSNYYYEEPYADEPRNEAANGPKYHITSTIGANLTDGQLRLKHEGTTNIIRIDGVLSSDYPATKYRVYARVGEVTLETDFCQLERASKAAGEQYFSLSIQRRYMAEGQIELFAINEETNEICQMDTLEVVYEE
ncbi:MAG TPA: hypothetical protein VJZ01_12290 [Lachnospiraceae bacterium]|nr:hypothetical protein [Lachnospiraceae bacterium]